ncbi:MAG: site-2 protease family protein, partial [Euryarchaeota archaeon]|nr:site-2 protease family protein [Euryarchaeota archaeon]
VVEVVEGSPAAQVLEKGMVIKSIGNSAVSTVSDFYEAVAKLKPGERISIQTDRGTYELVTAAREDDPERGFIGIRISPKLRDEVQRYFGLALPLIIYYSLYWIALLNEAIGWINLAPLNLGIAATDGHHVLRLILEKLMPARSAGSVATYVSTLMVLILLVSIVKPGTMGG